MLYPAFYTRQHGTEANDVEQAGCGVHPRRAQKNMIGLVAAQHVVDESRWRS